MKTAALLAAIFAAATTAAAQNPPRPLPFPGAPLPVEQPLDQAAIDAALGVPLYPDAVLLGTFNANPNQPFYLYGSKSSYANVVEYYKGVLSDRGRELFDGPMHQFDLGRFRRETMALQPSVTVKDFTWNGRDGYVHVEGTEVVKYPVVIQVVPLGPER